MLSRSEFCSVYVPMAKSGCSAAEIAEKLGVEKAVVTRKAASYRQALKSAAKRKAEKQGLSEAETEKLVEETAAKLPKLQTRTRETEDFADMLDALLAECDADPSDEGEDEESTEAPE